MKSNQSLIYGIHPVIEALESGKTIDKVWIQEGFQTGQLAEIIQLLKNRRIIWRQVPPSKLNSLVRGNHQGIVISLSSVDFARIEDVIDDAYSKGKDPFILVLDGITDVRNFGAITRTALSAGVDGIIIPETGAAPVGPDSVKTSAGALLKIPICRTNSMHHSLKHLKNSGLTIVGATEKATQGLYETDFSGPLAVVMGNEEKGISNDAFKMCDYTIKIPMAEGSIDSLNVGVATGVVIYEAFRQRLKM